MNDIDKDLLEKALAKSADLEAQMGVELNGTEVCLAWIAALRASEQRGEITEEIYNRIRGDSAKINAHIMAERKKAAIAESPGMAASTWKKWS